MNGRIFCERLPLFRTPADMPGPERARLLAERERLILGAVYLGDVFADWEWVQIEQTIAGKRVLIQVMPDALMVGKEDPIRVNLSMPAAQRAADFMSCVLPTWKIMGLVHREAKHPVTPCTQQADAQMADTDRMIRHSDEVSAKLRIEGAGKYEAHSTVGKDWVISNRLEGRPGYAVNGGWIQRDGTMIQARGDVRTLPRHTAGHVDYSQVVRLVSRYVVVDGELRLFEDIAIDPVLHVAVSDEGPLRVWRHPAVPFTEAGVRPADEEPPTPRDPSVKPPPASKPSSVAVPANAPFGDDPTVTSFRQARNFTKGPRRDLKTGKPARVDLVVIHDMEAAETSKTAENVAGYFATTTKEASAHYCVDDDSTVQCVRESDIAWHAPGANHNGVGLELAGYAKQTKGEWADKFSSAMLERVARLAAGICERHEVPPVFVDAAGLVRGERGITTHAEVSKAFKRSNHWDPGPNFPMTAFVQRVAALLG